MWVWEGPYTLVVFGCEFVVFIDVYCVNNKLDFNTCSGEPKFEVRVSAELHVPQTKPTTHQNIPHTHFFYFGFKFWVENEFIGT